MNVKRERGVAVIMAYKLAKAVLWLILAVTLSVLQRMGLESRLLGVAAELRHHTHAWSLALAELLVRAAGPHGFWTVVVALVADGVLSLVEGWALLRGRWWGPWVVVVSTGSLLPFEVAAFVRHPHAVRAALVVVNALIVFYLGRRAVREGQDIPPAAGR
jgi:uncharacterized membrane protein (DUF2068 family)